MVYAAVVSLANTIHRFLNSNLYSISLEEIRQIISLLETVIPFQHFLEEFPDKFKSLEGRIRELANEAEDILEYLVLEKVYLSSDEVSEPHEHDCVTLIKDIGLKMERMFLQDFADEALKGRFKDVAHAAKQINIFLRWEKDHIGYRDKWRFLPVEFAKFKSKPHFIDHLNSVRNEVDSILAEVMAIKNKRRFSPAKFPKFKFKHHIGKIRKEFDSMAGKVMSMKKNNSAGIKEDMVQLGDSAAAAATATASSSGIYLHDDDNEEEEGGECYRSAKHELQLKRVMEKIALVAAQVKEITHSSTSKDVQRGAHSSTFGSSSTVPPIHKDVMVGFEDYVLDMKDRLCGEPSGLQVIPICGMGGIGKTTLARNLYHDPLIMSRFDVRVWVTISQDYSEQKILSSIVESLKEFDTSLLVRSDEEKVHQVLMWRRYLIVIDDMWSSEVWDIVRRVIPDDDNGSRVMLTTRLFDVASYPDPSSRLYEMSLLSEDQSWDLFKQKVFANEDCPSELEFIGKEIARICGGLPLAILVIGGLMSMVSKNPISWQVVARDVRLAKTSEQEQIEDILSLSYTHLPQYLRPCFLYMGSFAEDDEIPAKKLIRLWIAEGFVNSSPLYSNTLENMGEECLEELIKRNLVLVTKRKCDGRIKSCSLHDLVRDLCIRKAHESKFFLNVMDRLIGNKHFIESIKDQRRVSVDSSYIRYLSSYDDDSTIRSIKCSKYRLVELKFLKSVRLLTVLDAEAVEVMYSSSTAKLYKLFCLRYLSIRCRYYIPQLSDLRNLETLIICSEKQHEYSVGLTKTLRLGWCMPQLRHVCFYGTIRFDDPGETTCPLENLQTLSHVDYSSCTERILKLIPNLKELQVDCSYCEDEVCLNGFEHLHQLESLEIFAGRKRLSPQKFRKINFPRVLKKLTLRKLELFQDNIILVGSLPCLQVLKLKDCTLFRGKWETIEGEFLVLEVLLIKFSRFEDWITESSHFPMLKRLLIDSCEDLNEIPSDIGEIPTLQLIEVRGKAKRSLMKSVEQIQQEQQELENNTLQVVSRAELQD